MASRRDDEVEKRLESLDFVYFSLIGFRAVTLERVCYIDKITSAIEAMRSVSQVGYRKTVDFRNAWDVSLKKDFSYAHEVEEVVCCIESFFPDTESVFIGRDGTVVRLSVWLAQVAAIGGF